MKKVISILLLLTPVYILVFCTGPSSANHKRKTDFISGNTAVVLELFTSQGCSSCPPADKLLGYYADKENIMALSFHVDYWNRLGWKDPFSDPAFSQRQEVYAHAFGSGTIYTPQIIINGQKEMVGSDEDKIAGAIKHFQSEPPRAKIIIAEVKVQNNKVLVTYVLQGQFKNSNINIALVQNKISSLINGGENQGVTLTNYNIVRKFKTINPSQEKNTIALDLPDIDQKELSLILFVQDTNSYRIYTATKAHL